MPVLVQPVPPQRGLSSCSRGAASGLPDESSELAYLEGRDQDWHAARMRAIHARGGASAAPGSHPVCTRRPRLRSFIHPTAAPLRRRCMTRQAEFVL